MNLKKNNEFLRKTNVNCVETRRFYSTEDEKNGEFYSEATKHWNEFAKFHEKTLKSQGEIEQSGQLTHFDQETQQPRQVDISEKKRASEDKVRVACASGYIQLNKTAFDALIGNKLKKGNALIVSKIAAIQASKQAASLIPLCHQILLDVCDVEFETDAANLRVRCEVVCKTSSSKTGVEIESLTACSVALLTIYDMIKAVQKDAVINEIKLEYKSGGKSDFKRN